MMSALATRAFVALVWIFQVQRDAFLAAIEHREIDAVGAPTRDITAHLLAAARTFDLDDFRAGFSQEQCRHRPGQQRGKIKNENALERSHDVFFRILPTTARRAA
jgi:hypothetical protein